MASIRHLMVAISFLGILSSYQFNAQSPTQPSSNSGGEARSLDALLQDYAYRAFNRPRTGVQYDGNVPVNISGIKVSAIRLRGGSLWLRGVRRFNEFDIPTGVVEAPYVARLALVYQNLGNWSSVYYQLPGYTFVAPVLGLLAYDATNLSATNLSELDFVATMMPITITFSNVSQSADGHTTRCVWFNLNGVPRLSDSQPGNICKTYRQGHFALVVNASELASSPPIQGMPPTLSTEHVKKDNSSMWNIVGGVVGGFMSLIILLLLAIWIKRYKEDKKLKKMFRHAEFGEVLHKQRIGDAQLPIASVMRTRPVLENELGPQ